MLGKLMQETHTRIEAERVDRERRWPVRKPVSTSGTARRYSRERLPWAMTSPVGWPVGEPPGGSSDTASVAPAPTCGSSSGGTLSRTGWPAAIRPSEAGLPPSGISHNSIERLSAVSSAAGTIVRLTTVGADGGDEIRLLGLGAGQRCEQRRARRRLRGGPHADIDQRGDAGGCQRRRADAQSAPEREALPDRRRQDGARVGCSGGPPSDASMRNQVCADGVAGVT